MAKQETTKEVAVKTHAPMAPAQTYRATPSVVDVSDIIVPKILLAQGLSKSVADNKAKMGDFTNSLNGAVIGNAATPMPFIPVTLKKYWKKFELVNGKKQFRGVEPFTRENANRERETDGPSQMNPQITVKWSYDLTIDLYGFTEDDVQDPISLPTVVSFTRTSYKAGQKANTHFAMLDGAEPQIPYSTYMLEILATKTQNDKGIFYTFDLKPKMDGKKMAKTPTEYFPKIDRWSKLLNDSTRNIAVDDAGEDVADTSATVDNSRF